MTTSSQITVQKHSFVTLLTGLGQTGSGFLSGWMALLGAKVTSNKHADNQQSLSDRGELPCRGDLWSFLVDTYRCRPSGHQ